MDFEKREAEDVLIFLQSQTRFRTSKEIAEECGLSTSGTCPKVRRIIAYLVEHKLVPIATCGSGYMITNSKRMMQRTYEDLEGRIVALKFRQEKLLQIMDGLNDD